MHWSVTFNSDRPKFLYIYMCVLQYLRTALVAAVGVVGVHDAIALRSNCPSRITEASTNQHTKHASEQTRTTRQSFHGLALDGNTHEVNSVGAGLST